MIPQPDRDIMEEVWRAQRAIARAVAKTGDGYGWKPQPGCAYVIERDEYLAGRDLDTSTYRSPFFYGQYLAMVRVFAMVDGLRSTAMLLDRGLRNESQPMYYGPSVTLRMVLEAAAAVYWLCQPGVGGDGRALRVADELVRSAATVHRGRQRMPADHVAGPAPNEWPQMIEILDLWGIPWAPTKDHEETGAVKVVDPPPRPGGGGASAVLTDMIKNDLEQPLGGVIFHLLSDVAHAGWEGLLRHAKPVESADGSLHFRWVRDRAYASVHVSAMFAVPNALAPMFDLFGWDHDHVTEVFAARMQKVNETIGPSPGPIARFNA